MPSVKAMGGGSHTIYALAATTATHSINFTNAGNFRGLIMVVESTAIVASPALTPAIEVSDGNGGYEAIWTAGAAISTATSTSYHLYPGVSGGNFTEVDGIALPVSGRFTFTHGDADSITYAVTVQWLK